MPKTIHINKLAVIGVGLIGGSFCRALKRANAVTHICGYGRNSDALQKALELGVIDSMATDLAGAVQDADVVMIATPLGAYADIFAGLRDHLSADCVVTDAGSVKGSVVDAARTNLTAEQFRRFVPGHPVAGTEQSGVEAAFAELFDRHRVILTPLEQTEAQAVQMIEQLWQLAGAEVVQMSVAEHDAILAATSHLPHMLAYALVDCLAGMDEQKAIFRFAAGGFADFTRIASSHPQMWHDICFANREELLTMLDQFQQQLDNLTKAIRADDRQAVIEMFTRAKNARDHFSKLRATGPIPKE
ncbi:MAG: prephenate dehydrogenase/arogenate dehydrogenase family protein [Gammaproteobacteria bacterium]